MSNTLLFILIGVIFLVLILINYIFRFLAFKEDFDYLKMELRRSEGREKKHWRKKRRLLLREFFFYI